MKKISEKVEDDPLDHEIDFSKSRPNLYWLGVVDQNCVRLLDRDLADQFPDDKAVNEGLRALLRVDEAIAHGSLPEPQRVQQEKPPGRP